MTTVGLKKVAVFVLHNPVRTPNGYSCVDNSIIISKVSCLTPRLEAKDVLSSSLVDWLPQ